LIAVGWSRIPAQRSARLPPGTNSTIM